MDANTMDYIAKKYAKVLTDQAVRDLINGGDMCATIKGVAFDDMLDVSGDELEALTNKTMDYMVTGNINQ